MTPRLTDSDDPADVRASAADLQALTRRLQEVREEERVKLSRELHDTLGQHLTAFALRFEVLCMDSRVLAKTPGLAALHEKIIGLAPLVEGLIERTQTICAALRPSVLDELGLVSAIEWLVDNTVRSSGLAITKSLPAEDVDMERGIALALFRIVQESLSNVIRHAQATQAEVRFQLSGNAWELEVQDNGRGFATKSRLGAEALGLLDMRERAAAFGGTVDFLSVPGQGTTVRVRIPDGAGSSKPGECT
jgi:signal transduction histidine kinase